MNPNREKGERTTHFAEIAAAVGLTVVGLRAMKPGALTEEIRLVRHALTKGIEETADLSLAKMWGHGKKTLTELGENISKHYHDDLGPIELNTLNRNSLLGTFQQVINLKGKGKEAAVTSFFNDNVLRSALQEGVRSLKDIDFADETIDRRTNQIIDMLVTKNNEAIDSLENGVPQFSEKLLNLIEDTYQEKANEALNTISNVYNKRQSLLRESKDGILNKINSVIGVYDRYETYAENFSAKKVPFFSKVIEAATGYKTATIKDVLAHADQIKDTSFHGASDEVGTILDELKRLVATDERFNDLVLDNALKIKNDTLVYNNEMREAKIAFEEKVLYRGVGKLLKPIQQMISRENQEAFYFIGKNTTDYFLEKHAEGKYTGRLTNEYVRILNKTYRFNGAELEHLEKLDNFYMINSINGFEINQIKNILGEISYKSKQKDTTTNNKFLKKLGLFSNIHTSLIDKVDYAIRKRIGMPSTYDRIYMLRNEFLMGFLSEEHTQNMYKYNKQLLRELDNYTQTLSNKGLKGLSDVLDTKRAKHLLEIAKDKQSILEYLDNITKSEIKGVYNNDLAALIKRYHKNSLEAVNSKYIKTAYGESVLQQRSSRYTKTVDFYEQMRKELTKEAILDATQNYHSEKPYETVFKAIANSSLSTIDKEQAKRHFHLAQFSEALNTGLHSFEQKDSNMLAFIAQQTGAFFNGNTAEHIQDFTRVTKHVSYLEMMHKKVSDDVTESLQRNIVESNRPNRRVHLQKGISPLDIIKNLNQDTLKKAAKQFVAGRKDMENITSYTLFPYFMVNRLQADVQRFGIGLSREDTGSVLDLVKNITLKRALPVYAVGFGLSYLNDLSKEITGTSLKGAASSSLAQFNLGLKTITDIAQGPLKDAYYWLTPLNYIADNEYQTKEEKRKWYETGYTPVKEGKFWVLGSSEFFGGKTTYFQPNYVKRSQVEWRDIGVYGSSKEKWAHSLIPTPTHPLSTIRYLLDPYWLERKQKYHRPYPVSGPMFDASTPWGVVGNMTIGQMIKPQKRLNKEFMLPSSIDVRDIVAQINNRIRTKAEGKYNTFTIKGSDTFIKTDKLRPTDILGGINHFSAASGSGIVDADVKPNSFLTNARGEGYSGSLAKYSVASEQGYSQRLVDTTISKTDKFLIAHNSKGISRQKILDEIERINTGIKMRARLSYGYDTNLSKEYEQNAKRDVVDLLNEHHVQSDLRNITSTKELLSDAAYSVGELSGIYGFLTEQIIPTRKRYAMARSSSMYGVSNRFWQTGMEGFDIGGTEDGPMEIIRRFIPHEDRSRIRVNPLRNDMPSWLPQRFQHGDPYTLVKKGEMRLPGPAYEALHADEEITKQTLGPSVISGSKEEILNYLIHGSATSDASLNRGMEEGTELHEHYEKLLLKAGIASSIEGELIDEVNGIHGFYDAMLNDRSAPEGRSVMDIKTVNMNRFAQMQSEGMDEKHKRQVNYYLGLLGLSKGYVMYVNRDDPQQMLTYSLNFSEKLYKETLNNLKAARQEMQHLIDTHQLSPYENYSDFHKFQILADVAPGSAEYKKYRALVAANLKDDPEKTEAYEATLKRVEEQSKKHHFYNYKFTHTKMESKKGVVESVDGNTFTLVGDSHTYNLAGIAVQKDRIEEYLKAGQEILIQFEANKIQRQKVNAIAFANGMNINRQMLKAHDATHDDDGSATATRAVVTPVQTVLGKPFEILAHAPIPYVHSKFMRVDTPLQSWLNEHVYGTSFQSWSHPIDTMIKPALRKDMAMPLSRTLVGIGAFALNEYLHYAPNEAPLKKGLNDAFKKFTPGFLSFLRRGETEKTVESLAHHFFKFTTPGAFTGSIVERVIKLNKSDEITRNGARIGATIALTGSLLTKSNNPFVSVGAGASLGYLISDFLERDKNIMGEGLERIANEFSHSGRAAKGALIGAAIGLGITGAKTDFNFKKMFQSKWIPKETQKRWEIEEYFDRLEYIKYEGLFEKAAALAERKEHVNIKQILKEYEEREKNFDKNLEEIVTLRHQFENSVFKTDEFLSQHYGNMLDKRYNDIVNSDKTVPASEFVRSALAYKQAMESTVYALDENSSYAQILRALPAYERDYYLEFMKETDPKEQKKILASIAPYKRKILQNAWGMQPQRQKSNYEYFQGHYLPNMFWKGWHADQDIEQTKIRTIENEGMQLSDFGYYSSAKDDPRYEQTAPINYKQTMNPLVLHTNLVTALNGIGLSKADVSIEPRNERGIHFAMNVTQVGVHRLKNGIRDVLGAILY